MSPELREQIDRIVVTCCQTLVPAARATIVDVAEAQPPTDLVAVVGFSGDHVRGSVGLCATLASLRATHPQNAWGQTPTQEDLQDWIGESANQLLGRLKVHLEHHGVALWMGTPLVLRGVAVCVSNNDEDVRRYSVENDEGGHFTFWLDLQLAPGVLLELADGSTSNEPEPGSMLLF